MPSCTWSHMFLFSYSPAEIWRGGSMARGCFPLPSPARFGAWPKSGDCVVVNQLRAAYRRPNEEDANIVSLGGASYEAATIRNRCLGFRVQHCYRTAVYPGAAGLLNRVARSSSPPADRKSVV